MNTEMALTKILARFATGPSVMLLNWFHELLNCAAGSGCGPSGVTVPFAGVRGTIVEVPTMDTIWFKMYTTTKSKTRSLVEATR